MDSLRQTKLDLLQQVQEEYLISEKAGQMARAAIDYNNFIYREEYPFYHRKKARENEVHELGENFYGYRNALNLNDKELAYFKPYYHYVKNYLGNLTYMDCSKNCGMEKLKSKDHLHYNKHKLYLVVVHMSCSDSFVVLRTTKSGCESHCPEYLLWYTNKVR